MTSTSALGMTQITLQFTLDRNIDAAAQDVQAAIAKARAPAAAGHADPAVLPEGQPGRPADPLPRPDLAHPAALRGGRVRADDPRAAHLDDQRRGPGAGLRLAEVRGARPARPERAGHRAASASTRWRRRSLKAQREPAHRHALRAAPGVHASQATGQLTDADGVPAADRGLPQRLAGAPRGPRARHRQRRERQGRAPGTTTSARSSWPSSGSRAPTPSRWWTPSASSSRRSGPSCPPRSTWTILYDRRCRSATRSHDVQVHAAPDARASSSW